MTREEMINQWAELAETVFWAEEAIAKEWDAKICAFVGRSPEDVKAFAREYCRAIATEIVSKTSDAELAQLN